MAFLLNLLLSGEVTLAEVPVDKTTWSLGSDSTEGKEGSRFDFSPTATRKRLGPGLVSPSSLAESITPPSSSSPAPPAAISLTSTAGPGSNSGSRNSF